MDSMLFERTQTEKHRQELYDFNLFQLVAGGKEARGFQVR